MGVPILSHSFIKGFECCINEWECPYCHTHLLRDLNAALNILYEGIRAAGSSVLSLVDYVYVITECLEIFLSNCEVRTIWPKNLRFLQAGEVQSVHEIINHE